MRIDPRPDIEALRALFLAAWGAPASLDFTAIWARSLAHLAAYDGDRLVGYLNVAWDGGVHASIFDTTVHPDYQRRGVGTALVREAVRVAGKRGADWLHVDFEPHLLTFYRACGFGPTEAGLMRLR
ncbi:MAG TPA: GNAT family N-acetyltransferase [Bauldia sp.]|nr:GNAT family N-acetyltransferase [Bauldia sp.]